MPDALGDDALLDVLPEPAEPLDVLGAVAAELDEGGLDEPLVDEPAVPLLEEDDGGVLAVLPVPVPAVELGGHGFVLRVLELPPVDELLGLELLVCAIAIAETPSNTDAANAAV